MALPANITGSDNNVLSIAASNNKSLLIRFLNEQVEDGFYALADSVKAKAGTKTQQCHRCACGGNAGKGFVYDGRHLKVCQ